MLVERRRLCAMSSSRPKTWACDGGMYTVRELVME